MKLWTRDVSFFFLQKKMGNRKLSFFGAEEEEVGRQIGQVEGEMITQPNSFGGVEKRGSLPRHPVRTVLHEVESWTKFGTN